MSRIRRLPVLTSIALAAALIGSSAQAASPGNDPAVLAKIRDAAMVSDYAWQRTEVARDILGRTLVKLRGEALMHRFSAMVRHSRQHSVHRADGR